MREKHLKTDGGTVAYWISAPPSKEGKTLFFLHGLTGDHTMFQPQIACFEGMCGIVAWDAPGHGKSRPFAPFDYGEAAAAVRAILEQNSIPSAVFIGQSLGGYVAQAVLRRHPALVEGFVSIDSTPYGLDYYSKQDIWWLKQVEWMSRLFPFNALKRAIAKQNTATQAGYDNMLSMLAPYSKEELCHLMGVGYAGFLEDNCDLHIPCPTLLLLGEQDRTGKVRQYNLAWAKRTGFDLVVIPRAAHNSNVDNPDAVNRAIEHFLASAL